MTLGEWIVFVIVGYAVNAVALLGFQDDEGLLARMMRATCVVPFLPMMIFGVAVIGLLAALILLVPISGAVYLAYIATEWWDKYG